MSQLDGDTSVTSPEKEFFKKLLHILNNPDDDALERVKALAAKINEIELGMRIRVFNRRASDGDTPLATAIHRFLHHSLIKGLLAAGAFAGLRDKELKSPLEMVTAVIDCEQEDETRKSNAAEIEKLLKAQLSDLELIEKRLESIDAVISKHLFRLQKLLTPKLDGTFRALIQSHCFGESSQITQLSAECSIDSTFVAELCNKYIVKDVFKWEGFVRAMLETKEQQTVAVATQLVTEYEQLIVEKLEESGRTNPNQSSSKLRLIGVPKFYKYAARPEDELNLKQNLFSMAKHHRQNYGISLVLGAGGNGKSTIMSTFLWGSNNIDFFADKDQCNVQVIMWLNCYSWEVTFDKTDFTKALLKLGQDGIDKKEWEKWSSLHDMISYYRNVLKREILFIFDDCFNPEIVLWFRCTMALSSPCCAIARYRNSVSEQVNITGITNIEGLPDAAIKKMLRDTYGLHQLSDDNLMTLARHCCGSPLVASLWAGLFKAESEGGQNEAFEHLIRRGLGDQSCQPIPGTERDGERTAGDLFLKAMEKLSSENLQRFFTFLLADPVEPVAVEDLSNFWRVPIEKAWEILREFVKLNLIRQIEIIRNIDYFNYRHLKAYVLHQVLHEAACRKASTVLTNNLGTSLAKIRISIIGEYVHHTSAVGKRMPINTAFVHSLNELVGDASLQDFRHQILVKLGRGGFDKTGGSRVAPAIKKIKKDSGMNNMLHYASIYINDPFLVELICNSYKRWRFKLSRLPYFFNISRSFGRRLLVRDYNSDGRTPLSWAAENGHQSVVEYLHQQWPDAVKSTDTEYGQTPLSWAAKNGHLSVIKYLYQQWPNAVKLTDTEYGRTPFSLAASNGHLSVVEYLYQQWPDAVNLPDTNYGRTPLSLAAMFRHQRVVEYLYQQWPDIIRPFS